MSDPLPPSPPPSSGGRVGSHRKRLGAWYTPPHLVDALAEAAICHSGAAGTTQLAVVDPACGDGRLLAAVGRRLTRLGIATRLVGVDLDPSAVASARANLADAELLCADALTLDWSELRPTGGFDIVIGNPPFRSQMSATTTRGGANARSGGPYADTAVEFLSLAAELVRAEGGCVAYVLPQSVLASRDAGPVRRAIDARARIGWAWWSDERHFDADVHTCALAFEFGAAGGATTGDWTAVVTERLGVPPLPAVLTAGSSASVGTLADRAWLNANFRDEYYGMIPAVGDHATGPPLISSGLIDPGRHRWGERRVRFAKRSFLAPRLDLDRLDTKMRRWAERRLVPKVLVANQTRVVEAVCDPSGELLPAVPVTAVYPGRSDAHGPQADAAERAWQFAALLTSAAASVWVWHRSGGTGLSARAVRIGPRVLGELPWPTGSLALAVEALRSGDVHGCSTAVAAAYDDSVDWSPVQAWWSSAVDGLLDADRSRA